MYLMNPILSFLYPLSSPSHPSHSSFSLQVPFPHSCLFVLAPEFNQGRPCNHGSKTIQGSWRVHRWMDHWWWVCGLESHYQHSRVPSGKGNSAAPSLFTMSCCPVLCKPSEDNQKAMTSQLWWLWDAPKIVLCSLSPCPLFGNAPRVLEGVLRCP